MKAFTKHKPTGSSKPLFSGDLSIVNVIDLFEENFEETLTEIIDEAVTESQGRVREAAYSNHEWSKYSDSLTVSVKDTVITYAHNGTDKEDQEMFDLEFGGPSDPPNSILRKSAERETQLINNQINKSIAAVFGNV